MNLLLTADWQCDRSNLDLCQRAAKEVEALLKSESLDGVFFLGDLKRAYDPVAQCVIKFWQRFIARLREQDYYVGILLGNHDRENQYDDKQNWLEILEKAGAKVFDEPAVTYVKPHATKIYVLPWSKDVAMLKKQLKEWAKQEHQKDDLLLFHQDVKGAKYNQLGVKSDANLSVGDFSSRLYVGCFGGHIHLQQNVGEKVWYVGSPFCTDWGEANQTKCYCIVQGHKYKFVDSKIPGWFDSSWPGFDRSRALQPGSRIRVHVTCEPSNYLRDIERARVASYRKYPDADIVIQSEFRESETKSAVVKASDSDRNKIAAYVNQTQPDEFNSQDVKQAVTYLTRRLEAFTGVERSSAGVKFIRAYGKNFLSFKEVECDFRKNGITVVDGRNRDRANRSNGSGKTSFLQLIPVALFGRTFKGQKHDRWARRGTSEQSSVVLVFRDARGRLVKVSRSRKPSSLRVWIDKVEQSSGVRSDARDATQGLIEQVSGYTWQTLANAVYIDQTVAQAFLNGTKAQRSEILARFLNLERFQKALGSVKQDADDNDKALSYVDDGLTDLRARIEETEEHLQSLRKTLHQERKHSAGRVKEAKALYFKIKKKAAAIEADEIEFIQKIETELTPVKRRWETWSTNERQLGYQEKEITQLANRFAEELSGDCPTCLQPVSGNYRASAIRKLTSQVNEIKRKQTRAKVEKDRADGEATDLESEIESARLAIQNARQQLAVAKNRYHEILNEELDKADSKTDTQKTFRLQKQKLAKLQQKKFLLKKAFDAHTHMARFYEYCKEAFSRDGIPAFLNSQLIPVLNHEADYYSDLFCDKAVQVRFEINNGEFEVKTINATGGEDTSDQSTGEAALAGLITSFALCAVAPKTTVLILDEPGAGLDSESTRQFAAALGDVSLRSGSVFVTSHNPILLGELGQENVITIEKRKGVSRVE